MRIALELRTDQSSLERYFYLKRNVLRATVNAGGTQVVVVAVHAEAYAKDGTKQRHIERFEAELDHWAAQGKLVLGAGDLNTLPPGTEKQHAFPDSVCTNEDFVADDYRNEATWLESLYAHYESEIPLSDYQADNARYFSHTTDKNGFWNRKLDYFFTNAPRRPGLGTRAPGRSARRDGHDAPFGSRPRHGRDRARMKRELAIAVVLVAIPWARATRAEPLESAPKNVRRWSGSNALTVPQGRWEVALFGGTRHGLTDSIELGMNPLLVALLPHLEAKFMSAHDRRHVFAIRTRASYPTTFLEIVSKEGQFGLLPATSKPPVAVQLEGDAIASSEWFADHLVSVWLGLAVALHQPFTAMELPLLDFPFLYQRFAPLYGPGVPRGGFSFEGRVVENLYYATELVAYLMPGLPDVNHASAIENAVELELRFGDAFAFAAGLRTSYAKYPYGRRTHFLPYFDVRAGF